MATKTKSGDKDDAPLIDLNEASVKKLLSKAKKKGYVTYDELNDALPQGEMSSDQIEATPESSWCYYHCIDSFDTDDHDDAWWLCPCRRSCCFHNVVWWCCGLRSTLSKIERFNNNNNNYYYYSESYDV